MGGEHMAVHEDERLGHPVPFLGPRQEFPKHAIPMREHIAREQDALRILHRKLALHHELVIYSSLHIRSEAGVGKRSPRNDLTFARPFSGLGSSRCERITSPRSCAATEAARAWRAQSRKTPKCFAR